MNITGKRFGLLTVIQFHEKINGKPKWLCRCDCGNIKSDYSWNLRSTSSCGCFRPQLHDLSGKVFGRLTVIGRAPNYKGGGTRWECECVCGVVRIVSASSLIMGRTQSCGCYNDEIRGKARTTHGHTTTKYNGQSAEYTVWLNIRNRCYNPSSNRYYIYGARGITVCHRWLDSFESFFADMGHKPSSQHSIDRINNEGNYEPGNCRWATRSEQMFNRRKYKRKPKNITTSS